MSCLLSFHHRGPSWSAPARCGGWTAPAGPRRSAPPKPWRLRPPRLALAHIAAGARARGCGPGSNPGPMEHVGANFLVGNVRLRASVLPTSTWSSRLTTVRALHEPTSWQPAPAAAGCDGVPHRSRRSDVEAYSKPAHGCLGAARGRLVAGMAPGPGPPRTCLRPPAGYARADRPARSPRTGTPGQYVTMAACRIARHTRRPRLLRRGGASFINPVGWRRIMQPTPKSRPWPNEKEAPVRTVDLVADRRSTPRSSALEARHHKRASRTAARAESAPVILPVLILLKLYQYGTCITRLHTVFTHTILASL